MGALQRSAPWTRAGGLALSLGVYAVAVLGAVDRAATQADRLGCVDLQAVQDQVVIVAGLLAGLALGATLGRWARAAAAALLPAAPEARRLAAVRLASLVAIAAATAVNALWVDPRVGAFIGLHRPLLVEADLLLYLMGTLAGGAWYALLDRQGWLGLLVAPAMALMLVSTGVVGRGWC